MNIELSPAAPAAPQVPPVPAAGNTSKNEDGVITAPTVVAPSLPKVEGIDAVDREGAELEVLHHMVGEFRQGDRILIADLPASAKVERLVKLGAVALLKAADAPAPQDAPKGKAK